MNHLSLRRSFLHYLSISLICLGGVLANSIALAAKTDLPGASIYQLDTALVDQDGKTFKLADRQGRVQLVSMFYTSCQVVCPMLIDTLQQTTQQITPEERKHLDILVITFDPARDTVARLKSVMEKSALDSAQWTFARPSPGDTRKVAATLGIQYRATTDGEFNHTSAVIMVDQAGRIVARTNKIGETDREFIEKIRKTLGNVHN